MDFILGYCEGFFLFSVHRTWLDVSVGHWAVRKPLSRVSLLQAMVTTVFTAHVYGLRTGSEFSLG